MQRDITFGPFTATVRAQSIKIGGFEFSPGQRDRLVGLLGIVEELSHAKALPATVGNPPFRVEFNEDGNHVLFLPEGDGDLVFTFESMNDLFETVNGAYNVAIDLIKLQPNNYVGRLPSYGGGDTFDGAA